MHAGLSQVKLDYSNFDIRKYKNFNEKIFQKILNLSKKIQNKTIIHINAAQKGGGVAELLKSQLLWERHLGLQSYWLTIKAPEEFFEITKKIHNLLQGQKGIISEKEKNLYLTINHKLEKSLIRFLKQFNSSSLIIIIHDPQPLPIIFSIPNNIPVILRMHIDLSSPNHYILKFLNPYIKKYSLIILSSPNYSRALPSIKKSKIKIVMPAIDPLSEKNQTMDLYSAKQILEEFGINPKKPIITQVSRFDPWKDPIGVIKAYLLAKNEIPDLQLVLVGFFFAKDDPEAKKIFKKVSKITAGDPNIFLFSDPKILKNISNDLFINALYTASDVIIQKSIREGFGLTITEAMWKEKPLIAGKTSGSLLQIKNNKNGIIVSTLEETKKAIVYLIKNKNLQKKLGKAAKQSVKKHFLFPRFILENLKIYESLKEK